MGFCEGCEGRKGVGTICFFAFSLRSRCWSLPISTYGDPIEIVVKGVKVTSAVLPRFVGLVLNCMPLTRSPLSGPLFDLYGALPIRRKQERIGRRKASLENDYLSTKQRIPRRTITLELIRSHEISQFYRRILALSLLASAVRQKRGFAHKMRCFLEPAIAYKAMAQTRGLQVSYPMLMEGGAEKRPRVSLAFTIASGMV